MTRRTLITLALITLIIAALSAGSGITRAQDGPDATTIYQLNMRAGPGTTHQIVTTLDSGTGVMLEARNADTSWVLGHTADGAFRGWLASLYLGYRDGFTPTNLPVSDEIVSAPDAPAAPPESVPVSDPVAASAGGELSATISVTLNIRQQPGLDSAVVGQFPAHTPVLLEGRDETAEWVFARTADGSRHGWVAAVYVAVEGGASPEALPVTDVELPASESEPPTITRLRQTPIVATATARAQAIFQAGLARGNHPDRFSKVGDCQNITSFFLGVYDRGEYMLGPDYAYLQDTIDHFAGSFARESASVWSGFNVYAVLDPTWSDPSRCARGESPMACEYRLWKPSYVIISLEVWHGPTEMYVDNLRQVLDFWISKDVVPILATKADNREDDWSINAAIAELAWEYDIPLWNFFMAAQPLPDFGLTDGFHLSYAQCDFTSASAMQNGWPWRNLTALQSLDSVRRGVGG
jgi:uncharacterized protein YraI